MELTAANTAIVIDSTANFRGMCDNVAFSLSLYSGQMCTAPQNIYVPREGIDTPEGHLSFDQVAAGLADAVKKLVDSVITFQERSLEIVNEMRQLSTQNSAEIRDAVEDGKRRIARLVAEGRALPIHG